MFLSARTGPHQLPDGLLRFMALATLLLSPEDQLPGRRRSCACSCRAGQCGSDQAVAAGPESHTRT